MKKNTGLYRHLGAVPIELAMLLGAVVTSAQGNWKHAATSLFSLGISFAPLLIERWLRIKLPYEVHITYVMFIFSSMFAGEVLGMYGRIWVWDDMVHFVSGFLIATGVILGLQVFIRRNKHIVLPAWFESLCIFCIATTVAVIWEIVEFTSDQLFGTFSQGADLGDTMIDLIYGAVSALMTAILWVFHRGKKDVPGLGYVLQSFEKVNK